MGSKAKRMWSIVGMSSESTGRGRMTTTICDLGRVDIDPVNMDVQWRRWSVTIENMFVKCWKFCCETLVNI